MRSSSLFTIIVLARGLLASPTYPMAELSPQQDSVATPNPPGLEFLYTLNCTLAESFTEGDGPFGYRKVIPIIGGTVQGPKINGVSVTDEHGEQATIRNLGADWNIKDSHNVTHPDTRYGFTTDDGAEIYIRTFGSHQSNGLTHLHGLYETGSEKYWWMNDIVAFGLLHSGGGAWVKIDMWYITSDNVTNA